MHQRNSQFLESGQIVGVDHQLVWIGAPVTTHSHGLAPPDQLGAAAPEVLPTPEGMLGWLALQSRIPAFHGLGAEPITDQAPVRQCIWLGKRTIPTRQQRLVKGQVNAQFFDVLAKSLWVPQAGHARVALSQDIIPFDELSWTKWAMLPGAPLLSRTAHSSHFH